MKNIAALTSVRFIAALAVFVSHYLVLGGSQRHFGVEDFHFDSLHRFLIEGRYGVTLFFVLSGFLLTARYYDSLYRGIGFKTYWIKRFARIMPLYWSICLAVFAIHLVQGQDLWPFLIYFSLTQAFFEDLKFQGVETAWSLTVEECFYLTLPFIILSFRLVWRDKRPLWVNLLAISAVLVGFIIIWHQIGRFGRGLYKDDVFADLGTGVLNDWGLMKRSADIETYMIFGRFFDFAAGCLFGMIYLKSSNSWLKRRWTPDLVIVGLTVAIVANCFLINTFGGVEEEGGIRLNRFNAVMSALIIYFLCADGSIVARLMSWRVFVYFGEISYALYLVHKINFTNWMYAFTHKHEVHFILAVVLLYAAITLLSAACYELIERPCQHFILTRTGVSSGSRPPRLVKWIRSLRGNDNAA